MIMKNPKLKNLSESNLKISNSLNIAFTMIELLIVVAIIGVLTTASLFAVRGTREAARDTQRKSSLASIASAFEIYKSDCNYYPNSITAGSQLTGSAPCNPTNTNVYMQAVPDDPVPGRDFYYEKLGCTAGTNCTRFKLWASLEDPGPLPAGCSPVPGGCGGSACNFCLFNP
jgi:prepilin-type N-terminal cleavage/methylation domain-containing protein